MTKRKRFRIAFLSLLMQGCLFVAGLAQTSGPQPSQLNPNLAAKIAKVGDAYANLGRFHGSVLVAKNDQVILSRGYGLANIEFGVPNTSRTRFDIGSLSKQFTAAAILKLEAEGKLSVNDMIGKHLTDYPKPQSDQVTLHHLLTHTSGIPSLGQRGGIPDPPNRGNEVTLRELIELFKDKPLQFKPGEKYRYNNSGYILLAAIIEKSSGEKYDVYLKRRIFDVIAMTDTGRIPAAKVVSGVANGYMGYAPEFVKPAYVHPSWAIGAGGIYSTVEDLFKWDRALYTDRLLPVAQLEKFFAAHVSRGRPRRDYAYGWFLDDVHGHRAINHGGTTEGFVAAYYRFPAEHLFIVVLSNYMPRLGIDISDQIADRISAAVFGDVYELPPQVLKLSAHELREFLGDYQFESGYTLRIRLENGRLISKAEGRESWTLPTYSNQVKLDANAVKVKSAVRLVRAFADGDHLAISALAAPGRRAEITTETVLQIKNELAENWGKLLRITPFALTDDGSVRTRVTFSRGEMFMMIEFNNRDEFVGWFYGNRMMPIEAELIPVTRNKFYVDGFRYDEGARWGEKAVYLEFTYERDKPTGVKIVQDNEHWGKKCPKGC